MLSQRFFVDNFHRLYYSKKNQTWKNTYWCGEFVRKCPFDLWVYQEIICEVKPDLIVECGAGKGGSALFFAHMLDIIKKGKVISIDVQDFENMAMHKRIQRLKGSSVSSKTIEIVKSEIKGTDTVMVVLDSDHRQEHVEAELELYSDLVSVGSYLIVEDSHMNGHPVNKRFGKGPFEAIESFLLRSNKFVPDKNREKFMMTFNPLGYLKRVN
ncbi:MAG: cephalosporin hydroxylase [Chitinivibrionales bacterium]|nr:cephalosporin hydroxylase [Chitinivibrionales bacterium]